METTGSNVDQIPTKQGPEDGKLRLNEEIHYSRKIEKKRSIQIEDRPTGGMTTVS